MFVYCTIPSLLLVWHSILHFTEYGVVADRLFLVLGLEICGISDLHIKEGRKRERRSCEDGRREIESIIKRDKNN